MCAFAQSAKVLENIMNGEITKLTTPNQQNGKNKAWPISNALELDERSFQKLVNQTMRYLSSYIRDLPELPAFINNGDDQAKALEKIEDYPPKKEPMNKLLDLIFNEGINGGLNPASPGYMAYVPGGGIFHAAIADLVSNIINRYVGMSFSSPTLSQLESNVLRWFGRMVGFPSTSRGLLTSGGTMATLCALVTARETVCECDCSNAVIYFSDQTHHSLKKTAAVVGFSKNQLLEISSNEAGEIDIRELEASLDECLKDHRR